MKNNYKLTAYIIFFILFSVSVVILFVTATIDKKELIIPILIMNLMVILNANKYISELFIKEKDEYRKFLLGQLSTDTTPETSNDDHKQDKENSKDDSTESDKDIIALMLKNNDELTEYFKISKTQS